MNDETLTRESPRATRSSQTPPIEGRGKEAIVASTTETTEVVAEATEEKAPRIKAENAEYAQTTLPTLRSWLRYWEGVKTGTRKLTAGSEDTVEMAPVEIEKLQKEISFREANRSNAGPNGK